MLSNRTSWLRRSAGTQHICGMHRVLGTRPADDYRCFPAARLWIPWYPDFDACWKLKRRRQNPHDSISPFVDLQSPADLPISTGSPPNRRCQKEAAITTTRALGVPYSPSRNSRPSSGRTDAFRKNALVTVAPLTFSMSSPKWTSKGSTWKLSAGGGGVADCVGRLQAASMNQGAIAAIVQARLGLIASVLDKGGNVTHTAAV